MFRGFANVWTIVGSTRALPRGRPLPLQIAGERLVLFRDEAGRARGLVDRCPHRGVQLSLGRIIDGCIECPFHGWRFDGEGANRLVPWNPDARLERLGATPVPVREAGGLLWVHTAPGLEAACEPELPEVLTRADVAVSVHAVEWRAHWTRAMENMLDWPHLPFVHARTIGHNLPMRPGSRMDIAWEDRPWGGHTTIRIDGQPQMGALDYRFPNWMHLQIPSGGRTFELMNVCIPVDEARTRMLFVTVRDFLRPRLFDRLFAFTNARVAAEDQRVLESSQPMEVPSAAAERSVRTDEPTLRFRKIYRDRLQQSEALMTVARDIDVPAPLRVQSG